MDARDFAVLTLDEKRLPGMPRQAFKRRSPVPPSDPRDRALGEQIVLGVVKNLGLLEHLLTRYADRPARSVDARSRLVLLVALYQIRLLDRVPDHAVVTEAVRQTRRLAEAGLGQAGGFVNAVLRQALRDPDVAMPSRDDPAAFAEVVFSHPRELYERLATLLGVADALRFCEHDNRTPPTLVRLAKGRTIDDLRGNALSPDVVVVAHEQPGIALVEGGKVVDYARWSELGVGQVQDATSAAVVGPLSVEPGMTVLDRCCGVGTKTQQLAELVGPGGRVFAVDALGKRISTLRQLASRRADLANVTAKRAEWMAELPAEWPRQYDGILIDAPCSNSGVMARRAEARFNQTSQRIAEERELQLRILADTWPALRPGGRLGYATCSVWPEENGEAVRAFLASEPSARLLEERATLPSFEAKDPTRYHDGGYVATIERDG